jgi:hypothetical protein
MRVNNVTPEMKEALNLAKQHVSKVIKIQKVVRGFIARRRYK